MPTPGSMRSGNSYFLPSPVVTHSDPSSSSQAARTKFLLVVGGVCSSLGKGVTTSTIGALLKMAGFRVSSIKIDPYINVDAGLMSPFEHGEVYVLDDGGEVDLDLGNYERWMGVTLGRSHNITTGKIYDELITRERQGKFLGKTVQVVPHFTNAVIERIKDIGSTPVDNHNLSSSAAAAASASASASAAPPPPLKPDICLIELGGTVGDLESAPFMEALRQLRFSIPPEDFLLTHVTHLPSMGGAQKTKPTQHSSRTLLGLGMSADFLVCRTEEPLADDARRKLSQLCGIQEKYIFGAHNVSNLYDVPRLFDSQGIVEKIVRKFRLNEGPVMGGANATSASIPTLEQFNEFSRILHNTKQHVTVAFVGKYVLGGGDAYFSVLQAFEHCCLALQVKIRFVWVDAQVLEDPATDECKQVVAEMTQCDGIFVAGGFGLKGIEGKIFAAKLAREKDIPYLGVCLGFQVALVEFARNVCGIAGATSEEWDDKALDHVIMYMPEIDRQTMGANMRLGGRKVHLTQPPPPTASASDPKAPPHRPQPSKIKEMYSDAPLIKERHRHRYEFNIKYMRQMQEKGVLFTATDDPNFGPDTRMEGFELPSRRFFVGVQYHPEFRSWAGDPSPPFCAFLAAAAKKEMAWPKTNSRAFCEEGAARSGSAPGSFSLGDAAVTQ